MTCQEFLRLLENDGAAATPEAAAHAGSCPACGRALERWRATQQALRAMAEEPPPEFLTARVMAHVRAERRESPRTVLGAPLRWRMALAPALVVVLVVSLGAYALWRGLRSGNAPVREARIETAAASRIAAAPPAAANEGRAAPATVPAPAVAAPERRPETRAPAQKRQKSTLAAGGEPQYAPQPASRQPEDRMAAIEAPARVAGGAVGGAVGGTVGGVLAAAPAPPEAQAKTDAATAVAADRPIRAQTEGNVAAVAQRSIATAVAVSVAPADGGLILVVHLTAYDAPPRGERWRVDVAPDRRIALHDAIGRNIGAAHPDALAVLRVSGLQPGVYRLYR